MIEVQAAVDFRRPAPEVFAFLSDWSNNPQWQKGMVSCTWTSEPPLQLGSTYDQVAEFLGRPIISSFEVVEFEPDRMVRIRSTKSSIPLDITREVVATSESESRISAIVRGGPTGIMRLLNPLTKLMVQRSVRSDYERLQQLLS